MLNLKFIQENKETVIERLAVKNFDARESVEKIIALDNQRKSLQQEAEAKQAQMNIIAKEIGKLMQSGQKEAAEKARQETADLKSAIAGLNSRRTEVSNELTDILLRLPNMPHASVAKGKSEADNEIVKIVDNIPQKHENDLPHWELARKYDLIDFETGVKITGAGFPLYKGLGVTLPDGSIVWLNSDSELKCPAQFSGDSREINFSGEGYFDVVKNPEKPMIVKLENGIQVIVKGTKFNLTSYKNDDNVSALLLSGNITVLRTKHSKQEEIKVKPNERIWIEKKERQKVNLTVPAETLPILGWKDGWLIFDETPIAEVLKKLERWHGMTFEVKDPEILDQKFTARFHEESISQILEIMHNVALLRFEIKDKTAVLYKY